MGTGSAAAGFLKGTKMTTIEKVSYSISIVTAEAVKSVNSTAKGWQSRDVTREAGRRPVYLEIGKLTLATMQAIGLLRWSDKAVLTGIEEGKLDAITATILETVTDITYRNYLRNRCVWLAKNPKLVEAFDKHVKETGKKCATLGSYVTAAKNWDKENSRQERDRTATPESKAAEAKAEAEAKAKATTLPSVDQWTKEQAAGFIAQIYKLCEANEWDKVDLLEMAEELAK